MPPEKLQQQTFFSADAPTYRELIFQLAKLSDEQLDMPVTVELDLTKECLPGIFDITGPLHDSLDDGVPVIRIKW